MTETDAPPTAAAGQDPPHPYTEEALARLMLSDAYREVADLALHGVTTGYDGSSIAGGGSYVEEAAALVAGAESVLRRAVVYERERGTSWEEIGAALGIAKQSAHKKFAADVERWRAPFDQPERLRPDGTPDDERIPHGVRYAAAPSAAAAPPRRPPASWRHGCARTHPTDSWPDHEHPVTGGLPRHSTTAMLLLADRSSFRLYEDQLVPGPQAQADLAERRAALYERLVREGDAPPEAHQWIAKDRARATALRNTPGHGTPWDAVEAPGPRAVEEGGQ
ncbi:hypothetical protein [Streptomyces chrestomyceticus]|uniref:hypothetical protein n=1 Tax=Streptomyces chrestomyceticus TaxID=68185 RepID=UPI0033E1AD54